MERKSRCVIPRSVTHMATALRRTNLVLLLLRETSVVELLSYLQLLGLERFGLLLLLRVVLPLKLKLGALIVLALIGQFRLMLLAQVLVSKTLNVIQLFILQFLR